MQVQDAVGDLVGSAGEDHSTGLVVVRTAGRCDRGAADLGGTGGEHAQFVFEVGGFRPAAVGADEAVYGDGDVGGFARVPGFAQAWR